MLHTLPTIKNLLNNLQQVPYLASKNLYRVASHFLQMDPIKVQQFCATLVEASKNLQKCSVCCVWKEKEQDCLFCSSHSRNKKIVCLVETWQELLIIDRSGAFNGVFHVLGGAISPLNGVGPDDLSIHQLIKRVASGSVQEIILATNQTPEGEATASFIANKLEPFRVKISCLAKGVPVGSTLEYTDRLTLYKALAGRRPF